jgi:hypothetical protein
MENLKLKAYNKIIHPIPLPMTGQTSERLQCLFELGREDLSLAKICEAHWDAISILHEANKTHTPQMLYGVWASEIPGKALKLEFINNEYVLNGTKMFCSGAGIIDKVLVTAEQDTIPVLLELDLQNNKSFYQIENTDWCTPAFKETNTSSVTFTNFPIKLQELIGKDNWYINRKGFWMGAIGPAACWGGGAAGLLDYAQMNNRHDSHTLAHLGAMSSNIWAINSYLLALGQEFDKHNLDITSLQSLALKARHLIELHCTDIIRRFARAYGPFPLACVQKVNQRYLELDLYLRQSHAERDLEILGKTILNNPG